jgi:hypothetical protein
VENEDLMDIDSLPARLYLLTYDEGKDCLRRQSNLGLTLRAAALTELYLTGQISDADGRPRATAPTAAARRERAGRDRTGRDRAGRPGEELLAALLEEIATSRPRRWKTWVRRGARRCPGQVRAELAARGALRIDRSTVLGVIPLTRVEARDRRAVKALVTQTRRTLRGTSMSPPRPREAATVALAAAGGFRSVATRRELRAYRSIVNELTAAAGPAVPALVRAIRDEQHAAGG